MNNSQSSDVFSGSENYAIDDHTRVMNACRATYDALVENSRNMKIEATKPTFTGLFSLILEDCSTRISQTLDIITIMISDSDFSPVQLCEHLDNTVNILRMLSSFLTEVIEAVSMNCCNTKTFPTATGRIILTVFSHCKDSESIYGAHLKTVERQLKDLFRNCHDLQLTYLMALGKHFVFDLTEYEQLSILIEALDVNLKIGKIVQTLDVKTMAEQWKAYTAICEKYSDFLVDKHIYEDCTKVLCKMVENNIQSAAEIDQEDKITLRSLKVASFTIKILLRVCSIFKHALNKNYDSITEMLLFIYLYNSTYLESEARRSAKFIDLLENTVGTPCEALVKELVMDENFHNYLFAYKIESIAHTDKLLTYILIITSAMKSVLQVENANSSVKHRILDCIYKWLPYGHIWFNMGLKFKSADSSFTCGLYEHLLKTTFAMASTFIVEEINYLERKMYESLLGTECYSALFSSNLWDLIARTSSKQFLLSQVISLCKVYQTLESDKMFCYSPQRVFLSQTLKGLFSSLNFEDKTRICKQFRMCDNHNFGLWSVLEMKRLDIDQHSEEQLFENLGKELSKDLSRICPEEIEVLIKVMRLTATCSFSKQDVALEDCVVKAWLKWCPENGRCLLARGALDKGSMWCLEYITALASLTTAMLSHYWPTAKIVKILHVISSLIEKGNAELKLALMRLLLKLSEHPCHEENKNLMDTLFINSFTVLLQDTDSMVQSKFWNDLRKFEVQSNTTRILKKVLSKEHSLKDKWFSITSNAIQESLNLKEDLIFSVDFQFSHKCIEYQNVIELSDSKTSSNNFDFADIDTLFEVESDSEPACKKAKLDNNEAEDIIARLEKDVSLLSNIKENIVGSDCKVRIRILCEKLVNIID